MHRLAILDDYQGVALSYADFSSLGSDVEIQVFREYLPPSSLAETLRPFDIIVAMRERTAFRRELLEQLPELSLLLTTGGHNASIDIPAANEQGVVVCGTEGLSTPTMELTWALLLSLARHVPWENAAIRAGNWQTSVGIDLNGATLGLVGLGRLGSTMVPVAHAFGMNVIAWSTNLDAAHTASLGVKAVGQRAVFADADFVSVHLILSKRTRGLIGAAELGAMNERAFFINTSRGPIVDNAALLDVLQRRAIAGAGLDVYDIEPLPVTDALIALDNVVLTPHLGYVSQGTYAVFYPQILEAIEAYLRGTPIRVIAP